MRWGMDGYTNSEIKKIIADKAIKQAARLEAQCRKRKLERQKGPQIRRISKVKKGTKLAKVLKHLRRKSMTPIDIIQCGVLNPYHCIMTLRRHGYVIDTREQKDSKMCRYYLDKTC